MTAANMAGVQEAKTSLLGFNPAALLAGAGVALIVEGGKSMIENAEKQEVALKSLSQAYGTLGEKVPIGVINDFIDKNAKYVGSIYQTEQAFAMLARAGFNDTMQQRLMNDALDLAVVKDESLTDAVTQLIKAHAGNTRALQDLGLSQKDVNALIGKAGTEAQRYEELLALLEPRLNGARKNTSDLKQSSSELTVAWQKISNENGPALEGILAAIVSKTDDFLNMLRNSGPVWDGVDSKLTGFIGKWQDATKAIDDNVISFGNWLRVTTGANPNTPLGGYGGRPWDKYGPGGTSSNDRQRGFGGNQQ